MLCFYSLFISLTPWVEKDGLGILGTKRFYHARRRPYNKVACPLFSSLYESAL